MTAATNTRLADGTIIRVRNAADDDWIPFTKIIDGSFPGNPSNEIDTSTTAGRNYRVGLPDGGQASVSTYDNDDDLFLSELEVMRLASQTRRFQLVMPEGTLVTKEFTAYVAMLPVKGSYNGVWTQTNTLEIQTELDWVVIPIDL